MAAAVANIRVLVLRHGSRFPPLVQLEEPILSPSVDFYFPAKLFLSLLKAIPLLTVIFPAQTFFAVFVLTSCFTILVTFVFFLRFFELKLAASSHLLPALGLFAEVNVSGFIINEHEVGKLGMVSTVNVHRPDAIVSLDPDAGTRIRASKVDCQPDIIAQILLVCEIKAGSLLDHWRLFLLNHRR